MIVDDSIIARAVLSRMIAAERDLEVVAEVGTAEQAIDLLHATRVDVVLLDLEMPGIGGLEALPGIIKAARGARVLVVSSLTADGAEQSLAALALGATDTLPKPGAGHFHGRFSEILLAKIRGFGQAPPERQQRRPVELRDIPRLRPMPAQPPEVLAIGSSTGGIHALGILFRELPARIGIPILVTQHLPPPFMPVFARQLAAASGREALVAEDRMSLEADRILIAPGHAHLAVRRLSERNVVVSLDEHKVASGCLPSADPMLASLAEAYGTGAVGVLLSGIGRDGSSGAAALVSAGGAILAQNEASSAVWGMPRAVAEAGLASAVLPPDELARRIASFAASRP